MNKQIVTMSKVLKLLIRRIQFFILFPLLVSAIYFLTGVSAIPAFLLTPACLFLDEPPLLSLFLPCRISTCASHYWNQFGDTDHQRLSLGINEAHSILQLTTASQKLLILYDGVFNSTMDNSQSMVINRIYKLILYLLKHLF